MAIVNFVWKDLYSQHNWLSTVRGFILSAEAFNLILDSLRIPGLVGAL